MNPDADQLWRAPRWALAALLALLLRVQGRVLLRQRGPLLLLLLLERGGKVVKVARAQEEAHGQELLLGVGVDRKGIAASASA